jgi:hypothetical protein
MVVQITVNGSFRNSERRTMYRILVVDNEQMWNAQKGYSDILELESRLACTEQRLERLQLPEKGMFGLRHRFDIGGFNQRRFQGIQQYFAHLAAQLSSLADSPSLSQFFSSRQASASSTQIASSSSRAFHCFLTSISSMGKSIPPPPSGSTQSVQSIAAAELDAPLAASESVEPIAKAEAEAQARAHAKAQEREAVAASTESKKASIVEAVTKAPFMLNPSVGTWLAPKPLQAVEAQEAQEREAQTQAAKAQAEAEAQAQASVQQQQQRERGSNRRQHDSAIRAAVAERVRELSAKGAPPEDAQAQADGSFWLTLQDGSTLRWSQRKDGTWRRPERLAPGLRPKLLMQAVVTDCTEKPRQNFYESASFLAEDRQRPVVQSSGEQLAPSMPVTTPPSASPRDSREAQLEVAMRVRSLVAELSALGRPSDAAEQQDDGSFLMTLEDQSTLRWTERPNGTWRKPEHKKAGWIGELEQVKYTPPFYACGRKDPNQYQGQASQSTTRSRTSFGGS